jgi:hypothetical protein
MNTKPDFICVGAQKAGTSWLWDQARSHPKIWMPPLKEIRYFMNFEEVKKRIPKYRAKHNSGPRDEQFWDRAEQAKEITVKEYASLFTPAGDKITGDVTPGYSALRHDKIQAIATELPNCRFIFLVRDPIDRVWSQVNMLVRVSKTPAEVLHDLTGFKELMETKTMQNMARQSRYIRRWKKWTGDRLAMFDMRELRETPVVYRNKIFSHIGLDGNECSLPADFNGKSKEKGKQSLPATHRDYLKDSLADEYTELYEIMKEAV